MSELQWHVRNPGTCGSCGKVCADRVTIQEANVDPGHYCDECAQKEVAARNSPRRRFARQLIAEAMEGAQDAQRAIMRAVEEQQRALHAAADVQVRMLHAVGIPLTSLTFVEGHPVTGVGVLPSIRHEATGLDLATFQWHEEARAWSVSRNAQAIAAIVAPKPPTLREWLGDRATELPPEWLTVLREQPVPAGWIARWEWVMYQGKWHLNAHGKPGTPSGIAEYAIVHAALGTTDKQWFSPWYDDGIVSGCFTRHPGSEARAQTAHVVRE